MKVKELQKTVNVAWSPAQQNAIMLAAGTAAQQLDASATSILEIYSANLIDPGYDFELKASQGSQYKFQKVIWSPAGFGSTHPNGLIVGGCEGGHLQVYSASKLLSGQDALLAHQNKHTGPIRGLDFNPFQNNLLASVASESEIFVWDLNNTTTPMTPGTKTQPLEDVQSVAWNRQVQHILASVFSSRCVIWDLRKNEQIMKLSDSQSRVRWRAVQWHPEIATQLWLASEEDQAPYVQLWDLRYATAPAKTMQIHSRGVLGLTWCPNDTDLMISCGKDNKIYCWNPNTDKTEGEILGEVATTIQWYSDVQWCPRNPALIASSSLEGNVSVYSLFGGTHQQVQTSNKIADSFPGMDQIAQAPIPQQTTQVVFSDLTRAPKWMKKKAGVSFGFGGRLISFNEKSGKNITVNQIITEPELIERANALEKTLEEGNFLDYCKLKADQMNDQHGRYLWYFIKANFELNPREEILNLLGYNKDDITNKFQKYVKQDDTLNHNNVENITNKMATLTHSDSSEVEGDQSTDDSTDLSGADNNALFDAIAAGNKTLNEISERKLIKYKIPTGSDKDGLISEAILSGNIEAAVEICMESGRTTEALIIASTAGIDFLTKTQNNYLNKQDNEISYLIGALVTRDWIDVMSQCSLNSWKEALVAALTHSDGQIGGLCAKLGARLQDESNDITLAQNSILCYICAGNLEKLVDGWLHLRNLNNANPKLNTTELQELVEIVMLLKKSLELRGQHVEPAGKLAEFLSQYAGLLAAQGALDTALSYLGPTDDPDLEDLRERLYYALGHKQVQQRRQSNQYGRNYYGNHSTVPSGGNRFNQPRNSFSNPVPSMPQSQPSILNNSLNIALPGQSQLFQPQVAAQQPWNVPAAAAAPTFNPMMPQQQQSNQLYNQGLPGTANVVPPPASTKPPTINDGLNHPQRPSSVGSQGSSSGPLTRSKYVVDPSVSSGPSYGQSMFNPAPTNLTGPPQQQFNLNPLGTDAYQGQLQQPSIMMQPQINPTNFKPFMPSQQNLGNYMSGGIPPIETGHEVMPPPPLMNKNPTPPPGWNDPPPLSSSTRTHNNEMSAKHAGTRKWQKIINCKNNNSFMKTSSSLSSSDIGKPSAVTKIITQGNIIFQPKSEQPKVNPITHPIFGVDPNHNQNGFTDTNSQYQNQSFPGAPMHSQMYTTSPPPPPQGMALPSQQQQIFNPLSSQMPQQPQQLDNNQFIPNQISFKTQAIPSKIYNSQENQQNFTNETVLTQQKSQQPIKEKPPLPEEFIYMQTVLEELKNQCLNVASDVRTKRKFADVAKRLETLYDALRDGRLSPNTINALNQIVQFLQNGDYANALATHTLIASGPDFSQTANFMPGIKVLVQSAIELKVYLR